MCTLTVNTIINSFCCFIFISVTMNFKVLKPILLLLYTTWHDDNSSVCLRRVVN